MQAGWVFGLFLVDEGGDLRSLEAVGKGCGARKDIDRHTSQFAGNQTLAPKKMQDSTNKTAGGSYLVVRMRNSRSAWQVGQVGRSMLA